MNNSTCQIESHKQKKIIFICFDTKCEGRRHCCQMCQSQLHKDHPDQLVDFDYLLTYIRTQSKVPIVLRPQISQRLLELQKLLNHLDDFSELIRKEMKKLNSMNIPQFCKELGNKYNILKADFQGLSNQDWNRLTEDMLSNNNVYIKDFEIVEKDFNTFWTQMQLIPFQKEQISILKKYRELQKYYGLNQIINKEYFQNFEGPYSMKGHTGAVTGIDICKHRNLLASGSIDGTVKLWSLADNSLIKTYKNSGAVYNVVFSKEGNLLAFGGQGRFGGSGDCQITLIDISDLQKNEVIYRLCGHTDSVWRLTFSNNSKFLVSGSSDKTVRIWSLDLKQEVFQFYSKGSVEGIALNSNDSLLAFSSNNYDSNKIRILDFQNKKLLCSQITHDRGIGIQFSYDDEMLVSSDCVGSIKLWSLQALNQGRLILIRKFKASNTFIWTVLFSPCSQLIISISNLSSEIKILDSQTGEVVKEFKTKQTNNQYLVDLAISKDMDIIAYGEDCNVVIWRNTQ